MCITLLDLVVFTRRHHAHADPIEAFAPRPRPADRGRARPRPRRPGRLRCRGPGPAPGAVGRRAGRGARRHRAPRRGPGHADRPRGQRPRRGARRRGRVGQHQRRPADPRGVPRATRSTSARSPTSRRSTRSGPAPTSRSSPPARRSIRWTTRSTSSASRPASTVAGLDDLRGKTIAYSPGQAQGALVLRVLHKAGLTKDDVELVELPSTGDVYVDRARQQAGRRRPDRPVAGQALPGQVRQDGATTIAHGLRDDPGPLRPDDRAGRTRQGGRDARVRPGVGAGLAVDLRPPRGVVERPTTSRTRA